MGGWRGGRGVGGVGGEEKSRSEGERSLTMELLC